MTPQIVLKFYRFCRNVFHFPVNSFLFLSSLWLKTFSRLQTFMMDFKRLQKKELLTFLRHKHNIWKVIKDYLVSKNILSSASRKPKMALCGDNGGIWRFILNYSITAHHSFRTINKKINDRFIFWITKWAEYCLKFYIENMFKVCFPCKFRSQKILSKYFCEVGVVVSC